MTDSAADLVTGPGPSEVTDPAVRAEFKRAAVWLGMICAIALVVVLIQPLLIIFGGLVFAALLDGGVRLIGKVLPIRRGFRLAIVVLCTVAFLVGTFYLAGVQITAQAQQLQATVITQVTRISHWASEKGILPGTADLKGLAQQALGSVGKLTSFVGTALGAITSLLMIMIIGLFVAMEPKIYDRGLQWMIPVAQRKDFAITLDRMGMTLRRLLAGRLAGMAFEAFLTWVILMIFGVPMALVLGLIAGILAFIPNIGAFITGCLMTLVGFSAGFDTGLYAICTYMIVQSIDGYVVIPMVAKRTVDLPPALTLSTQILASTLFGVIGLALADPMVAMIKVALERNSERSVEAGMGQEEPKAA